MKDKREAVEKLKAQVKRFHGLQTVIAKTAGCSDEHVRKVLAGRVEDPDALRAAARCVREAKRKLDTAYQEVNEAIAA